MFCLRLQIEHVKCGILVHQQAYIAKVLNVSTPMVVRSLDVENDPFRPRKEGGKLLGPEVPYLSAIGALMYLANNTRPDISFLSIYYQDIVLHPREDIGTGSSMYFVTFEVQWIWDCFIAKYPN
jgi:hypothetical protein